MARMLVMGANGFLGSHVTRLLVKDGHEVRVMVRKTSDPTPLQGMNVERCYGDMFDEQAVREAMQDRDVVFYCIVDTRAWLRDPAPLFRTNVEGLRKVLDIAVAARLKRFVYLSTFGTIGRNSHGMSTEKDPCDLVELGGAYVEARVQAENMMLDYARNRGLPAVAMCVATTFGPYDWQPTPQGKMVKNAALGKMPFYMKGINFEAVGIEDAARAMILAADKGRVGERYIVSERSISYQELYHAVAEAAGVPPPRLGLPLWMMYIIAAVVDVLRHLLRRDLMLTTRLLRLMHLIPPMDHGKATRDLGWQPMPVEESVREAVRFFLETKGNSSPS